MALCGALFLVRKLTVFAESVRAGKTVRLLYLNNDSVGTGERNKRARVITVALILLRLLCLLVSLPDIQGKGERAKLSVRR